MSPCDKNDSAEDYVPVDFARMKAGMKNLEDAIIDLGELKKINPKLTNKEGILQAIHNGDFAAQREISNFFYKTSGIYSRLCRYMAYLYRYDWMVTPYINSSFSKHDKVIKSFNEVLYFLDNFQIKKFFGEIALKVIKNGCYYGYIIYSNNKAYIQELDVNYCRSRFNTGNKPAVEFNMKFFDDTYKDPAFRMRVLDAFPKEFKKGYLLYKEGKLPPDVQGDKPGWYLLDSQFTCKFNIHDNDYPLFINAIPALVDLDAAQDLDRKKMAQKLLKIIIQQLPTDKNGELLFDIDEAQQLHNNAVRMLSKAIGVDVLTTFADVNVADLADKSSTTSIDELEKVERTAFNNFGTAQNLFNTEGNLALEKSILNDEASITNLILQFEAFLNDLIEPFNVSFKKYYFKVQILSTTIYNYKELAKLYKEQTQMGYSKMLPQIALGQSQSSILANASFENDILDLINVFIPPITSATMNADVLKKEEAKPGRTEKPDDQKSEKTIANKESMN